LEAYSWYSYCCRSRQSFSTLFPCFTCHMITTRNAFFYVFLRVFRSLWRRTSKDRSGRHKCRHVAVIYVGLCKSASCNLSSRVIARVGDEHMNVASYLNPSGKACIIIRLLPTHLNVNVFLVQFPFHFLLFSFG